MNKDINLMCSYIKDMKIDKLDNLYSQLSNNVYSFLEDKMDVVANKVCELLKGNTRVGAWGCVDALTYDLIGDFELYDEFMELSEIHEDLDTEDIIDMCSVDTQNAILNDMLYNYDALWLKAITECFSNIVGDDFLEFQEV